MTTNKYNVGEKAYISVKAVSTNSYEDHARMYAGKPVTIIDKDSKFYLCETESGVFFYFTDNDLTDRELIVKKSVRVRSRLKKILFNL